MSTTGVWTESAVAERLGSTVGPGGSPLRGSRLGRCPSPMYRDPGTDDADGKLKRSLRLVGRNVYGPVNRVTDSYSTLRRSDDPFTP